MRFHALSCISACMEHGCLDALASPLLYHSTHGARMLDALASRAARFSIWKVQWRERPIAVSADLPHLRERFKF